MRIEVAGKICRSCGGILEEVPDDKPLSDPVQFGDAQLSSIPTPSQIGSTEPDAEPSVLVGEEGPDSEQESAGLEWTCQSCGKVVPGNFDVCWKCLATKVGERELDAEQPQSEIGENDQEPDSEDSQSEAKVLEETKKEAARQLGCPRCGSTKIIHDVTVADQGEYSDGVLKAVVFGNPDALLFKDRLYGEVRADICGFCGHVELRVNNPSELYDHYQNSREPGT